MEHAIASNTSVAAYAGFSDDVAGQLTVGCFADLILFDRDFLNVDATNIPLVKVTITFVGGTIVFDERPSYLLMEVN